MKRPAMSVMIRVGRVMLNNHGLFIERMLPTANGKYTTTDYYCVFTGLREHIKILRSQGLGTVRERP